MSAALATSPFVQANLDANGNPTPIALLTLGGGSPHAVGANSTSKRAFPSRSTPPCSPFDPATGSMHLALGLLNPQVAGHGFDSLHLHVTIDSHPAADQTFQDAALATSFFHDKVLDLGNATPVIIPPHFPGGPPFVSPIQVQIGLDLVSANADDGFLATMLLAEATPVPEPSSAGLLMLGLTALTWRRRPRAEV